MDDLLADALEEIEMNTDSYAATIPQPVHTPCWEKVTAGVLADLGLTEEQIARYLRDNHFG